MTAAWLLSGCVADDAATASPGAAATSEVSSESLVLADQMLVGLGGKCMDVAWGSSASGTSVNLFDCNGTAAQVWHLDIGNHALMALGKCLDIPGGNITDRNPMQIWDCNRTIAQQFDYFAVGSAYTIRPLANTGFCIEVAGGFTDNWTPIQVFDCNGTASQEWHLAPLQTPDRPPVAPEVVAGTVTVRDHRGGTTIVHDEMVLYTHDRSLYEQGYQWFMRVNGGPWTLFSSSAALFSVDQVPAPIIPGAMVAGNLYEAKATVFSSAGASDSEIVRIDRR
jgi:hypothetical protein